MAKAQRRFGGVPIGYAIIQNPGDAAATVTIARTDRDSAVRCGRQLVLAGASGRLLTEWREHGRPKVATYITL